MGEFRLFSVFSFSIFQARCFIRPYRRGVVLWWFWSFVCFVRCCSTAVIAQNFSLSMEKCHRPSPQRASREQQCISRTKSSMILTPRLLDHVWARAQRLMRVQHLSLSYFTDGSYFVSAPSSRKLAIAVPSSLAGRSSGILFPGSSPLVLRRNCVP